MPLNMNLVTGSLLMYMQNVNRSNSSRDRGPETFYNLIMPYTVHVNIPEVVLYTTSGITVPNATETGKLISPFTDLHP